MVPDLSGDGSAELAVLGTNPVDGTTKAEVRDAASGTLVRNVWFDKTFHAQDLAVIPDFNGNGAAELGLLAARESDSARRVFIKDAGTGSPLNVIELDDTVTTSIIQCMPPVPPGSHFGIELTSNVWSGFRFQIVSPKGARLSRVGLQLKPEPGPGTIFAAFVRLSDSSDFPDDPALGGTDVIMVATISVPATDGSSVVVSSTIDPMLAPGWYAVVFGTGAFGATLANGGIPSAGGAGCLALPIPDSPFSIRQSDGLFILQGAEPHMFVELAP